MTGGEMTGGQMTGGDQPMEGEQPTAEGEPVGRTESVARTVREQARKELTRRIVEAARSQLAVVGAAGLSLRAVARELGMVSSAVYRYVPSRDDLLTRLIIEAYEALGEAAARAEARIGRDDIPGRWIATCSAVRGWALEHPHEYALIYGSPVPGYAAPQDTIGPASRVGEVLIRVIGDAQQAGLVVPAAGGPAAQVRAAIAPIRVHFPPELPDEVVVRALMAWTYLFGAVSFELFGHRHNVVFDTPELREAFFVAEMSRIAGLLGIPALAATS